MFNLLLGGEFALFFLIVIALVISLSFHEFGHAFVAKLFGDDTAQRAGRLTLNPLAHLDAIGLLMVVMVGFGYAKPVPTNPRNFTSRWADFWVALAGPAMNLVLAWAVINGYSLLLYFGVQAAYQPGPHQFVSYLVIINMVLMLFNLIPLGALDGHYILPYFLSSRMGYKYWVFNERYGNFLLMGLILMAMMGLPVFRIIFGIGAFLVPLISWV